MCTLCADDVFLGFHNKQKLVQVWNDYVRQPGVRLILIKPEFLRNDPNEIGTITIGGLSKTERFKYLG